MHVVTSVARCSTVICSAERGDETGLWSRGDPVRGRAPQSACEPRAEPRAARRASAHHEDSVRRASATGGYSLDLIPRLGHDRRAPAHGAKLQLASTRTTDVTSKRKLRGETLKLLMRVRVAPLLPFPSPTSHCSSWHIVRPAYDSDGESPRVRPLSDALHSSGQPIAQDYPIVPVGASPCRRREWRVGAADPDCIVSITTGPSCGLLLTSSSCRFACPGRTVTASSSSVSLALA